MPTALLLIDIQNDYFPGGSMELVGADRASGQAAALLARFREGAWPIIHVRHLATRPTATFFRPNTPGAEIHPDVAPLAGETVITKNFPNGFRDTSLLDVLRAGEIDALVIAGMMTHMCVDTTVRAAADLGFACTVVHDACATRDLSFDGRSVGAADVQCAYMAALNGSFAKVLSAVEVGASLARPGAA